MTYHGGLATHKILILAPLAYNLSPTTPPVFSLPDHALVTLEGPDAVAFAHAQFANDVAALAPGCWQWNAWLTPKGRVIAVFALARPAEDRAGHDRRIASDWEPPACIPVVRKFARKVPGVTPRCRTKALRNDSGEPNPVRRAITAAGSSPVSSIAWAASRRTCSTYRAGVVPTSSQKSRVRWRALTPADISQQALQGLNRIDCDTPQEEADTIALIMRETLEQPGKTIALITPDRRLARLVELPGLQ